ncbi:hypothetical protein H310_14824 [Aphanomyces invadans]|uniref:Calponin-homology (CH) domain-containing protein n=1 Tax=Aphanomyces invadans TaxID=157072 RepID=A0A024T8S2_9STRA|nr:hypothetical protein H310_14824 [Aphanomyces invadans]ETV90398.1 hypothetical protein H310_14824 [Aphanomyces invadans]|eukprot:XP_008880980.1 hypothetical protein H310_14824 [Aphanomyces invadans]
MLGTSWSCFCCSMSFQAPQMQRRPSNIQAGDELWIDVQKKAFTRWANSFLPAGKGIDDLYTDLSDGLVLIALLEALTEAPFPSKFTKEPRLRIHKLENLNMVFGFLAKGNVMVTNIGSSDILDGNNKLILGLMWTIIKHYQVGDIAVDGVSGKEGLLLWCNRLFEPFHFRVSNFTNNWSNGAAFCYLVHALNAELLPDVVAFTEQSSPVENLATAFGLLEKHFQIPALLNPEDLRGNVDEKSVLTYVSMVYQECSGNVAPGLATTSAAGPGFRAPITRILEDEPTELWCAVQATLPKAPTWAPLTRTTTRRVQVPPLPCTTPVSFTALGSVVALLYPHATNFFIKPRSQ